MNITIKLQTEKPELEKLEFALRRIGSYKIIIEKDNEAFNEEYADINGILLKRKNEALSYCEYFTWDEAMKLAGIRGLQAPSKEEWEKMLEPGSTWDEEKKGLWIGKNHSLKQETAFSTFLPAGGHRNASNGFLYGQGFSGYYWSAGLSGTTNAYHLYFDSGLVNPAYSNVRANGFSLRCIKKTKES
jgi:uncharacterized protein (TIGR02145 family)